MSSRNHIPTKVCHLSTVHWATDTRIFVKQCRSLAKIYDVDLIAPHPQSETVDGVTFRPLHKFKNKFLRLLVGPWVAFLKVLGKNYRIIHFHDPELIPVGLVLRCLGKKVIFDVHENIHVQIGMKEWLPFKRVFQNLFNIANWISCKAFKIIIAEDSYLPIYEKYSADVTTVLNMPINSLLKKYNVPDRKPKPELFYVGDVTRPRGIANIVKSIYLLVDSYPEANFHCIGSFSTNFEQEILAIPKPEKFRGNIKLYGKLPIEEAYRISMGCSIGLAVLKPEKNYLESYPTKLFEYMTVGLPFITSNFEFYKQIVEAEQIGYCVDPLNTQEIANLIESVLDNYDNARERALSAKKIVGQKYSWSVEEDKLLDLYRRVV